MHSGQYRRNKKISGLVADETLTIGQTTLNKRPRALNLYALHFKGQRAGKSCAPRKFTGRTLLHGNGFANWQLIVDVLTYCSTVLNVTATVCQTHRLLF